MFSYQAETGDVQRKQREVILDGEWEGLVHVWLRKVFNRLHTDLWRHHYVYILHTSALPDSYAYKLQAKAFTFSDRQEKQLTANVSGKKSFDFQASSLSLQASLTPLI